MGRRGHADSTANELRLRDALGPARTAQGTLVFFRENDGSALCHIYHIARRRLPDKPLRYARFRPSARNVA